MSRQKSTHTVICRTSAETTCKSTSSNEERFGLTVDFAGLQEAMSYTKNYAVKSFHCA